VKNPFISALNAVSEKLRGMTSHYTYWKRSFDLIWRAAPHWTAAWGILLIVQGILPAASVYLTKLLVDSLMAAIGSGGDWKKITPAIFFLALMAATVLMTEVLQGTIEWVHTAHSEIVQDYIKGMMHQQATTVDYAFYESPEYHDLLEQTRSEGGTRPIMLLESFGGLAQNGITLLAMSAILVSYGFWLPLVLFISTVPAFAVVLRFDRIYHEWWKQRTTDRRWAQYYDIMLTHSDSAAEIRLFNLGDRFQSLYQQLRERMRTERLRQMRRQSLSKLAASSVAMVIAGAAMGWMAWRALHGLATLGDLALFYQAFKSGQGLMRALLGSVNSIISNNLFLANLFAFLDLKPRIKAPAIPTAAPKTLAKGIDFRQVTFSYPGSNEEALKNFNLSIPVGKHVAIVGVNGAGKSTFLKLLCRFYDPHEGRIEIDGVNIRDFPPQELLRLVTVLFQNPLSYHATARDNIAFGNLSACLEDAKVEKASRAAGAHELISRLPEGYETILGKWFVNGAELSGGEWQRVALARAYIRQAPIILLDEPTSSMDSWSETDWFDRFQQLAEGRTAILITHRFTIAMRADTIHVLDQGQIIESGSHHELLARGGTYAQSWRAQMKAGSTSGDRETEDSVVADLSLQEVY
jgi:ATP-binding cassette, subfamily B, bacterial